MKITLWISEETLKEINTGEPITGRVYMREPGEHVDTLQVQVSEDEYYEIIDRQAIDLETTWECSLPEGAEWDVSYSLKEIPSFADVYDLTRATPNNFELGALIRKMVNDSDE
tara:strand:- start:24 stop:362 length:339 start_codon:yes stop_codon:yes gene_type:complete